MNALKYYKKGETHKHMNKNAYEIRLDVLGMAHGTIMNQYYEKLSTHRDNANHGNHQFDVELIDKLQPKTADIIAYANELYAFVEGR